MDASKQAIRLLDQLTYHEIDYLNIEITLRNIRDEILAIPRYTKNEEFVIETSKKRKKDTYDYKETEAYKVIIGKFGDGIDNKNFSWFALLFF